MKRRLVVAHSICKSEFGSAGIPDQHLSVLLRSMAVELAVSIKGSDLPPATRLLKVYATSPDGPRRIVHLLAVEDGTLFLLFYRDKQDAVGANVSIHNPAFRRQLHRHLKLLEDAIKASTFSIVEQD